MVSRIKHMLRLARNTARLAVGLVLLGLMLPGIASADRGLFQLKYAANSAGNSASKTTAKGHAVLRKLRANARRLGRARAAAPVSEGSLSVVLREALAGPDSALAGERIDVFSVDSRGRLRWLMRGDTDGDGRADFTIPGLGTAGGPSVRLRTRALGSNTFSALIDRPGPFTFKVGTLGIALKHPVSFEPLTHTRVVLKRVDSGGRMRWVAAATSDAQGMAYFDPEGLGNGPSFVAVARSPLSGARKKSAPINAPGKMEFVVGSAPVEILATDATGGGPVGGIFILARELTDGGKLKWAGIGRTDAGGRLDLELDGLAEGRRYMLDTWPFRAGRVQTGPIEKAGPFTWRLGTTPVTLVDRASGTPLAGKRLVAFQVGPGDKQRFSRSGRTDANGIVRFDLPGLGDGKRYQIRTFNPFGERRIYQTDVLDSPGPVLFAITNDNDLEPPKVRIETPSDGDTVSADGFGVQGLATDDGAVSKVEVLVGGNPIPVSFDPQTGKFTAEVKPAPSLRAAGPLQVVAVARDEAGNEARASVSVQVAGDLEPPKVEIKEPATGAQVSADGFKVTGLAMDNKAVASVKILIGGSTIPARYDPASGEFAAEVGEGLVKPGDLQLVAVARDEAGNEARASVPVRVVGDLEPPEIKIGQPLAGAPVSTDGFKISGTVNDNKTGASVEVLVGGKSIPSSFSPQSGEFSAEVGPGMVVPGRLAVVAVAHDEAGNEARDSVSVQAVGDLEPPEISIGEPQAGGAVSPNGFQVKGVATDNKAVVDVQVLIGNNSVPARYDAANGEFVADIGLTALAARALAPGDLEVVAVARDEAGNEARTSVTVQVVGDLEPPVIRIDEPQSGAPVSPNGFQVRGVATDNNAVADVQVLIGNDSVPASYDAASGVYFADIGPTLLSAGALAPGDHQVVAVARDEAGNEARASVTVQVMGSDVEPPVVTVESPTDGQPVSETGFVIGGTATDDSGPLSLRVTVTTDPAGGNIFDDIPVPLSSPGGRFGINVDEQDISAGETLAIELVAVDGAGNETRVTLSVMVQAVDASVRQLLNRITFAPTLALLDRVNDIGAAAAYLDEQLAGQEPEPELAAAVAALDPSSDLGDLQQWQVLHAIHARNQLREVLTVFWDNHFSTNATTTNSDIRNTPAFELLDNQAFRANALGSFRELLEISTLGASMLIYLDGVSNVAADPNENLPRELLELHTMEVDGGYTQEDVEEVARALTGWTVRNGAVFFDAGNHDFGEKTVLATTIPAGGGEEDAELVLDLLAAHPSTASHICTKLIRLLVDDEAPSGLVSSCATRFLATVNAPDQIAQVVRLLLESPEFVSPDAQWSKIKTPLEFVVGVARAFEADGDGSDLPGLSRTIGMNLFRYGPPTGFAEVGDEWVSSASLLERLKAVDRIAFASPRADRTSIEPRDLMLSRNARTESEVLTVLFELTLGDTYTSVEWDTALAVLTDDGTTVFDIDAPDADARLRSVIAIMLAFPGFQFQ